MLDRYDENLILGYIEGDLAPEQAAAFEKLLAADDELRLLVAALMRDRRLLRAVRVEQLPAEMASHVHEALERHLLLHAAADEKPQAAARPLRIAGFRWLRPALSAAAVIAIGGGLLAALDPWQWFGAAPQPQPQVAASSAQPPMADAAKSKQVDELAAAATGDAKAAGSSPAAGAAVATAGKPAATGSPQVAQSGGAGKTSDPAGAQAAAAASAPADLAATAAPPGQESLAFQLEVASAATMRQEILAWANTNRAVAAAAPAHSRRAMQTGQARQAPDSNSALKEPESLAKKEATSKAATPAPARPELPATPAAPAAPAAAPAAPAAPVAAAKSNLADEGKLPLADGQPTRGGKPADAKADGLGGAAPASPAAPAKPAPAKSASREGEGRKKDEGGERGAAGAAPGAARLAAPSPPPPGAPAAADADAPAALRGPGEPLQSLAARQHESAQGAAMPQEIDLLVPADKIDSLVAMIEDRTGQTLTVVREGDALMLLSPALAHEREALRKRMVEKQKLPAPVPTSPAKPADKSLDDPAFGKLGAAADPAKPPPQPDAAKGRPAAGTDAGRSPANFRDAAPQVLVRILLVEPKATPAAK